MCLWLLTEGLRLPFTRIGGVPLASQKKNKNKFQHIFTVSVLVNVAVLQASGVTVQQDCVTTFQELKLKHKFRYIVYSMTDNLEQIRVLKTAPPSMLINL